MHEHKAVDQTSERLARALEEHGAPSFMIVAARAGAYGDFTSQSATPETDLYQQAQKYGLTMIAEGVLRGEWDATKEESDAWAASPDGQETLRMLSPSLRRKLS